MAVSDREGDALQHGAADVKRPRRGAQVRQRGGGERIVMRGSLAAEIGREHRYLRRRQIRGLDLGARVEGDDGVGPGEQERQRVVLDLRVGPRDLDALRRLPAPPTTTSIAR